MDETKEIPQDLHSLIIAKHTDGFGDRSFKLSKVPVKNVGSILFK